METITVNMLFIDKLDINSSFVQLQLQASPNN